MRASRAGVLLLIGGGIAACAAPRAPEPAAARVETPTASPHATPAATPVAATPVAAAEPQAEPKAPGGPATPAAGAKHSVGALTGTWGGLHVLLTLSANGGRIEYDCGQGTLDEPVRPDAQGAFHVRGQHNQSHGGPARVADEPPAPQQATYDGTVSGDRMQLRVSSNGEVIGTYALRRGADPQMAYCL